MQNNIRGSCQTILRSSDYEPNIVTVSYSHDAIGLDIISILWI